MLGSQQEEVHFLHFGLEGTPFESNLEQAKENHLSRWQRMEQLRQHFWRR